MATVPTVKAAPIVPEAPIVPDDTESTNGDDQAPVVTKAKKVKAPEPMTAAEWIKHNREHARNRSKHGTA